MAKGYGQKELVSRQRESENKGSEKLPVKEGSIVEFVDTPEFNGIVRRVTKDQWQTVSIDYGVEGRSNIFQGYEIMDLFSREKIIIKKLPVKVGSIVEFVDTPEFNGIVKKIEKDQGKTVLICYSSKEGELKAIKSYDLTKMIEGGKLILRKK